MFISPYSYRASACLSLSMIWKILSFNFSSLSWAFSAEISSCFMFSPTVSNSCSTSFNFCSANSARSLALLSSSSWTPNFLVNSSSFCSLSLAIFAVSLKFLSASSISTSFLMVLFSKYLTFFKIPSASLEAMANLVTVSARLVSAFLASSSINMIRLDKAETSSSAFLKHFPFPHKWQRPWSACHWSHQSHIRSLGSSCQYHGCHTQTDRFWHWPPWFALHTWQWWNGVGPSHF